jgi:hypothetical protein
MCNKHDIQLWIAWLLGDTVVTLGLHNSYSYLYIYIFVTTKLNISSFSIMEEIPDFRFFQMTWGSGFLIIMKISQQGGYDRL